MLLPLAVATKADPLADIDAEIRGQFTPDEDLARAQKGGISQQTGLEIDDVRDVAGQQSRDLDRKDFLAALDESVADDLRRDGSEPRGVPTVSSPTYCSSTSTSTRGSALVAIS